MANFNLRTFLTENKLTRASKTLVTEDGTYTQKEILRGSMQGFKAPKPEELEVNMMVAPNMAYLDNQELLNQQMGRITAIDGDKVTYKKGDGKLYTTEVADLIIVGGLAAEGMATPSKMVKEDVIDFTDKEQYAKFLQFGTKELEGKKVKLNIFDTFANGDPEKEKFTGDIIVNLKERTSGATKIYFNGTLIDDGGYKYIAPLKGKEIRFEIPNITGGTGFIGDRDNQDDGIQGIFKVKTLEIIG